MTPPAALLTAALIGAAGCGGASGAPPSAETGVAEAAAGITAGEMRSHVAYLASDELRGRNAPSPGLDAAADYLARSFRELGLAPAGVAGGYRQPFPLGPSGPEPGAPPDSAPNVIALLPGSDPVLSDEYVVISAHFDHVGVGRPVAGDSIYNGADDNGSGTAALIEVAEAFASLAQRPARSLVFLAVSAEEKGLLGSAYYAANPTVPRDGIVANLNVDMIGGNAPDSIVVIGQEYSSLGPLVREVAERNAESLGLTVAADLWPEERFFFRSDHYNFARMEIPALFFFAGTHEHYHRPSDEADTVDYDKATRVARLIFRTGHAIAAAAAPPEWTRQGLAEVRGLTGGPQ